MRPPKGSLVFFRDDKGQYGVVAERLIAVLIVVGAVIYLIIKH